MQLSLLVLSALVLTVYAIPIPGNGVLQPQLHHQRYRKSEYAQHTPFYQWWYYWVKDYKNDKHYAFTYAMTSCKNTTGKCEYDGAFVGISIVDNKNKKNIQKYEWYSRENLFINQEFHLQIKTNSSQEPLFELLPMTNDKYRIRGSMKKENKDHVWICENCDKDLEIEWDLTLDRIYGYYAQDVFEIPDELLEGVIMWNTYSHCAEVEGKFRVGTQVDTIERNANYRAYGDGNWGEIMPDAPPHQPPTNKYAWGWYSVNIPNEDKSQEVSIIAGTGLTYADDILKTMDGRFGDIRLDSKTHIELRSMNVWNLQLTSCNDGQLLQFDVKRSDWVNITDVFGTASIPLRQVVTLESTTYLVTMDFNSELSNYNRLLFPFKDFVFSDFEGLGVPVHLTVVNKKSGLVMRNETLKSGGIEYGYRLDIKIPPLPAV